jgi:hypothetical protein
MLALAIEEVAGSQRNKEAMDRHFSGNQQRKQYQLASPAIVTDQSNRHL